MHGGSLHYGVGIDTGRRYFWVDSAGYLCRIAHGVPAFLFGSNILNSDDIDAAFIKSAVAWLHYNYTASSYKQDKLLKHI